MTGDSFFLIFNLGYIKGTKKVYGILIVKLLIFPGFKEQNFITLYLYFPHFIVSFSGIFVEKKVVSFDSKINK